MAMIIKSNEAEIKLLGPTRFSEIQEAVNAESLRSNNPKAIPWVICFEETNKSDERSTAMNVRLATESRIIGVQGKIALGELVDLARNLSKNGAYREWSIVPEGMTASVAGLTLSQKPVVKKFPEVTSIDEGPWKEEKPVVGDLLPEC